MIFFLCALLLIGLHHLFWFVISRLSRRYDVVDIGWASGMSLLAWYAWWQNLRPFLLGAGLPILVSLWSFRLALHLFLRSRGKPEDKRYQEFRRKFGAQELWKSFFLIFLLQAVIAYFVAIPLLLSILEPSLKGLAGILLFFVGFFYESVADWQLEQFKKTRKAGEWLQTGLWRYSRHPNYFGEILLWTGIFLASDWTNYGWLGVVSPALIIFLLTKVSGVPLAENNLKANPALEEYRASTPAVFPKFWR